MGLVRAKSLCISLIAASVFLFSSSDSTAITLYEKDDFKIKLSGHVQELVQSYEDPFAEELNELSFLTGETYPEHVSSNASRVRTTFRFLTGTPLSVETSIDYGYVFGSVLDSPLFLAEKELPPRTYWDLEYVYADGNGRYGTVSVYRAMATLEGEDARLVIGRQRLAYGTALFWSPIDIWNPVSPLALEPEEKVGVDGISGLWWVNDKVTLNGLAAMADEWDETRFAAGGSYRYKSYTFDFLAGKRYDSYIGGFDFVGYVGKAGIRGEFTYTVTEDEDEDDFPRAVIGMDYAWQNSLYVAGEYYHNGGPFEIDPEEPFESYLRATGVDTMYRNFLGATASYDLDPLITGAIAGIYDLDKGSWAIAPSLTWLATQTWTVKVGAQVFGGAEDGEFGRNPDIAWARIRWDY